MSSLRMIVIPMVGLTLSACGTQYWNQYAERKDTIAWSAGDAVASNSAVQVPTPWPRNSNNPNIAFDGKKSAARLRTTGMGQTNPYQNMMAHTGLNSRTRIRAAARPPPRALPGGRPAKQPPGRPAHRRPLRRRHPRPHRHRIELHVIELNEHRPNGMAGETMPAVAAINFFDPNGSC